MLSWLLNLVYLLVLVAAAPRLLWDAVRNGKRRGGWRAKLLGAVPRRSGSRRCVWLHAVSVGEAKLLQALLPRLQQQFPDIDYVVSVTTVTAYQMASKALAPVPVCYCPLDFSWAVHNALARIRPDVLILAELELWPNLIRLARRRGTRVAVVNGRLSDRSFRGYLRIKPLVECLLRQIDLLAVQSDEYARRFVQLGARPETVHVTGSLKFDGARSNRQNLATQKLAALAGIEPADVVWLVGSTQHPEEAMALQVFRQLRDEYPQLRLILVPRHPERFDEVARLLDQSALPWQRRSCLDQHSPRPTAARILLVDTVGELAAWWGTAHIAYVGGSMGKRGGQNMIEPAAYGAAVAFGPRTENFRDVVSLMLAADAATVVHDEHELQRFVRRCLDDPAFAAIRGRRASQLVRSQQGAADRTMRLLQRLLAQGDRPQATRPAA